MVLRGRRIGPVAVARHLRQPQRIDQRGHRLGSEHYNRIALPDYDDVAVVVGTEVDVHVVYPAKRRPPVGAGFATSEKAIMARPAVPDRPSATTENPA